MKWLPQRARQKTARSTREGETSRGADSDERFVVERMFYEGCPNTQPIVPHASVATFETEYSNRECAIG